MRVLNTTPITDSASMPVKSGTLDFLQQSYKEMLAELVQEMYPSLVPTNVNVLRDATTYSSTEIIEGQEYTVTTINAGVILSGGELFFVNESHATVTSGPSLVLTTAYYTGDGNNADPVLFTDSNKYYVHEIRTLSLADGTSETIGATFFCLLSDLVYLPASASQADITTINGDITSINGEITTINNSITAINAELSKPVGWTSLPGGGYGTAFSGTIRYTKEPTFNTNALGRVQLSGSLSIALNGTGGGQVNSTLLPVGFRPDQNLNFLYPFWDNGGGVAGASFDLLTITIGTDGVIVGSYADNNDATGYTFYLDNITFLAYN